MLLSQYTFFLLILLEARTTSVCGAPNVKFHVDAVSVGVDLEELTSHGDESHVSPFIVVELEVWMDLVPQVGHNTGL